MNDYPAVRLFERGYTDLVSVAPPGSQIRPGSRLDPSQLGKAPSKPTPQGWVGYSWLTENPTHADVTSWALAGANIGLRGDRYPALDIDSLDPTVAGRVEAFARKMLGAAPLRFGKEPKRLLVYRTASPFPRRALIVKPKDGPSHLIEMLGSGRQYLVSGTHPSGVAYRWEGEPLWNVSPDMLTEVTAESIEMFFDALALEMSDVGEVEIVGGNTTRGQAAAQEDLKAPSLEALEAAVRVIPNNDDLFPDREAYLKMGYAIKAAGIEDEQHALDIFTGWAGRHEGSDRVARNPDTPRRDWRRMHAPYSVGWSFIEEMARPHGFNGGQYEFTPVVPQAEAPPSAARWSDKWLAQQVGRALADRIRYVNANARWLIWRGGRWSPDSTAAALFEISEVLTVLADRRSREGTTPAQQTAAMNDAKRINSTKTLDYVARMITADPAFAVTPESLDADPWALNTPAGIVNLKTGAVGPADPGALCTKQTLVAPDFNATPTRWLGFLAESTGGDVEAIAHLQALCGYMLTGSIEEHKLWFIYGPGGNGKSVFLRVLEDIMGSYKTAAQMDTFMSTKSEGHPVSVAILHGARLVTATENEAGRRWNESRIKSLTGGDTVNARMLYGQPFEFRPSFKLLFSGNHRPELRNVDDAMRRRVLLVPFMLKPRVIDKQLGDKLRVEYPAILAWMLEGTKKWLASGIPFSSAISHETEEYFEEEDLVSKWLDEAVIRDPEAVIVATSDLLNSWKEWAGKNGAFQHLSAKWLGSELLKRGFRRVRSDKLRGFSGLRLPSTQEITL